MSKVCAVNAKKKVAVGNNVSHSNRKTRRRFLPNLQSVSFYSEALSKFVKLRVSTKSIRSIEHNNGIDSFLLKTSADLLSSDALKIKKAIKKATEKKAS